MSSAFAAQHVLFAVIGVVLGTFVGMLPGFGAVAAIALLIPALAGVEATSALVLLAAICYGTTQAAAPAAMIGDARQRLASARTFADALQLQRQGRAGAALAIVAASGFVAGCIGTAVIALLAMPFARLAFEFGPAEYFSLLLLGVVGAVVLASGSLVKGLATMVLGLLLAQIGTGAGDGDGARRFAFGIEPLAGGVHFVVVALGVFAVGAIVARLERNPAPMPAAQGTPAAPTASAAPASLATGADAVRPTRRDLEVAWPPMLRGTALGAFVGLLPGGTASLAAFAAYRIERRLMPNPRVAFGQGAIEGLAVSEAAGAAAAQTSFLPLLAFGIPANAAMALFIGAMTLRGIPPGPQVMTATPDLFWGLIASMWLGNVVLLLLHLPIGRVFHRLLALPYRCVFPAVVGLCCIAAATLGKGGSGPWLLMLFAVLGYALHRLDCQAGPLLIGFVLAPMLEDNARRALLLSGGEWSTFVTRPLSSGLLIAAALLVVVVGMPAIGSRRDVAFHDD